MCNVQSTHHIRRQKRSPVFGFAKANTGVLCLYFIKRLSFKQAPREFYSFAVGLYNSGNLTHKAKSPTAVGEVKFGRFSSTYVEENFAK